MTSPLRGASAFNMNLTTRDVSEVTDGNRMFDVAHAFNAYLSIGSPPSTLNQAIGTFQRTQGCVAGFVVSQPSKVASALGGFNVH